MSLQSLLKDAQGTGTDSVAVAPTQAPKKGLQTLLEQAQPIETTQVEAKAPTLPGETISAAPVDTRPTDTAWSRIGQAVLPHFLQSELGIAPEQRQAAPLSTEDTVRQSGNLMTMKEMQDKPENVDPLEYLKRGMSFGHSLDPTNTLAGYQKDVTVEDLPEPVTTKQKVAEAIGSVVTMSLAQPLIEAGAASLVAGASKFVPSIGKAADVVSTAVKLRPWTVGYPISIAKATAEGGLFGLITKNKDSLAHNVLTTAGSFAAFTALAYPIQAFFKPIIEQVGKATIANPAAQKVLGNPEITSKPIAQTLWFRNPKDPTQILKVTAKGATFMDASSKELVAAGTKVENLPTIDTLEVEAFKENPSLYQSLKEWVAGKIPAKTDVTFATQEDFVKATPVSSEVKVSAARDAVAKDEAAYAAKPTPELEQKIAEQRAALGEYRQTYAQPVVETPNIKVQVLPYDDGKWDVSVSAKVGQDGIIVPFGSNPLYPSKDAAIAGGITQVTAWANEKASTASDPIIYNKLIKEVGHSDSSVETKINDAENKILALGRPGRINYRHANQYAQMVLDAKTFKEFKRKFSQIGKGSAADNKALTTLPVGSTIRALGSYGKKGALREIIGVTPDIYITRQIGATAKIPVSPKEVEEVVKVGKGKKPPAYEPEKYALVMFKNITGTDDLEQFYADVKADNSKPTQAERVKEAVAKEPKSIKNIAAETGIVEPNIRRILGVGAKDGTFARVEKGVYILNKDGEDIAYVHAADALETLPKLAKEGVKVDMVFLDIPYDTPAVKGGNRGALYELISVSDFGKILDSLKTMTAANAPVIQMYSQANSGMTAMQKYNDLFIAKGWKPVGKGEYAKTYADGSPVGFPSRNGYMETKPEGIIVFTQDGTLKKELGNLNFKLVRPKGYQTEKAAALLKSLIEMTTEEGETVLDPFAGSGVTGAEAVKSGRKAILIEKNADVAEKVIQPRIENALAERAGAPKLGDATRVLNLVARPADIEGKTAPLISRNDVLTLLRNSSEFSKNPRLTVEQREKVTDMYGKVRGTGEMEKVLAFDGKKSRFAIRAEALGLVSDNLELGQKIAVDKTDLMKPSKEFRVMETDRATGSSKALASTGSGKIGNFEPVTEKNGADYNLKLYEQVQGLIRKFAARIGEGYMPRGTAGVMYPKTGSIRISGMNNLSVAAHEIAHFIDMRFGITKTITTPVGYREQLGISMPVYDKNERGLRNALSDVYVKYYPGSSRHHALSQRVVEGFATFVQKYLEMPKTIGERYPKLVEAFFTPGGKYYVQDINDLIADTRKIVDIYQGLDPLDKIGARVTHEGQEVEKKSLLSFADRVRTEVFDALYPLEKLDIAAGTQNTAKAAQLWARMYQGASALVLNNINTERGYWGFRGGKFVKLHDFNWQTLVKQLSSEKNADAFNYYLIARDQYFNYKELATLQQKWEDLDAKLLAQQRGELPEGTVSKAAVDEAGSAYKELKRVLDANGFTEKEVTDAYEQNKERFSAEADMFDTLVREDLDFMHDEAVQLVDPEHYAQLTSREGYASMKRDFYDEVAGESEETALRRTAGGSKASSLKQRTGSSRAILPPMDSAIRNHAEMTKKGLKQIVYNRLGDIGLGSQFPDLFHVTELKAVPDGTGRVLFPQEKDPDIMVARKDYKRVPILVDRAIKRVLDENVTYQNIGIFEQAFLTMSRLFTKGTTGLFIPFAVTNTLVDQIAATAQTQTKFVPIYSQIKMLRELMADTEKSTERKYAQEYLVLGGERQTFVGWQNLSPRDLDRAIKNEKAGLDKAISYLEKGVDLAQAPGKWSEILTRMTEYVRSRQAGDEVVVAIEKAGRVTAPFHHAGRMGGRGFITYIKSIPYLNATLQVIDQSIRTAFSSDQKTRQRYWMTVIAVTAAMLGSISVIMSKASKEQKDEYKDLNPADLGRYAFLPNPNGTTLIKIRMPQEMAVFGALLNMAIADSFMDTRYTVGDYMDASTAWLPQQLDFTQPKEALFSWITQAAKPALEVAANVKDYPRIMQLESDTQLNKPAGLRFTEGTSAVAKWIGKEFGISPIKTDFLLTGYFGRSVGYLTAKPGIYNPASVVNQAYYFSSGRRIQSYYDMQKSNDELYNQYTHKLAPLKFGQSSRLLKQRAILSEAHALLTQYADVDPEKETTKAQAIRQKILDKIDQAEKIKL